MTKSRTKGQRRKAAKALRQQAAMRRAVNGRRIIAPAVPPAVDGPTPERLAKAQGAAVVGEDRVTRIRDGIVEKLAAKGALWPPPPRATDDQKAMCAHRNVMMFEAAQELRRVHRIAGMDASPTSVNLLATGGGSGDKAYQMPLTMAAVAARFKLRAACDEVREPMWNVVVQVVVEDIDLVAAGDEASEGRETDEGARGVARFALRHGLAVLAGHWGYLKPSKVGVR